LPRRPRIVGPATLIIGVAFSLVLLSRAQAQPASAAPRTSKTATEAASPVWSSLSLQQRGALAPLERDWANIDASRKQKWLEIANRYPTMPPDERERIQQRMGEWARMTPAERGQARLSFQEAKQLSPQQRQARWEAYQALPEDERRALANRAQPKVEKARPAASAPLAAVPKQNLAASATARAPVGKPVAPTVVQAKPGATTTLMTKAPTPPAHQRPGQPKINATPGQVDRSTLLPKGGPQAAAVARADAPASVPPAQHQP
jgi:hypothetical protein